MTSQSRHQRVNKSRVEAHLSVWQLWLNYASLTGVADLIEVDAYLHGAYSLGSDQEDMLCLAVNEELDELHEAARLPYAPAESTPVALDPLDVLRSVGGRHSDTDDQS